MGGATERIGLPFGAKMRLLVVEIGPDLGPAVPHVLTGRLQSSRLAHFAVLSSTTTPLFRDAGGKGRPKINTTAAAKKRIQGTVEIMSIYRSSTIYHKKLYYSKIISSFFINLYNIFDK